MDHGHIIERLGDYIEVADKFARHKARVHHWKTDGIPPLLWMEIVSLARARGCFDITMEALAAGSPEMIRDLERRAAKRAARDDAPSAFMPAFQVAAA